MNESVIKEFNDTSKSLYIFFGGIKALIGMPPFEFYNSAKLLDENKMFLRDFSQSWYQSGLKGISTDALGTARYIETTVNELRPENVCFVGNSMGGFAAILFSELTQLHAPNISVIAFSPQTFISPALRRRHRDKRWWKQLLKMRLVNLFNKNIFMDLDSLMSSSQRKRNIRLYIGKDDAIDIIHTNHIAKHQGVKINIFENGGHNIVKVLRDNGQLQQIMKINQGDSTA